MVIPSFLHKGAQVALAATARKVSSAELRPAIDLLTSWGLDVHLSSTLYCESHQFAGTDDERCRGLQQLLDNPEIRAIFCVRGGYGTIRFIDHLDFYLFKKYPKWVCGFSDVTALHLHLHRMAVCSIHSTIPVLFSTSSQASLETLQKLLFGEQVTVLAPVYHLNRSGKQSGQVIGGNLSLLVNSIGTSSDSSWEGKILVIEDVDEYLYHIDRMMNQLKRSGKLRNLAGLVVGQFTDMKDNTIAFGKTAYEIIADAVSEYTYPVGYHFPIGHSTDNQAFVCGKKMTLSVDQGAALLF